MNKRQVTLVMGSPSIVNPFNQNRWDYVSTWRRHNGRMDTKDLVLYFENDSLTRIEGDYTREFLPAQAWTFRSIKTLLADVFCADVNLFG